MTNKINLLYGDLTYKVRGAMIKVHTTLGSGHKESVYQKALTEEFNQQNIKHAREKTIPIEYSNVSVGTYRPDFIVEDKIVVEIKAVPFMTKNYSDQLRHYLCGSEYKLGLLVNFGEQRVVIKRIIYDQARL